MNIVLYPQPKINIGLRVTARRSDGYHAEATAITTLRHFSTL